MKSNHQVNVVAVGEILPHPNADNLEITHVEGYQCVIGKGSMKPGDHAVYIQPDSVVPQTAPFEFIWRDHVGTDGSVPERRRRITVRRFRKEWSEGLLMPVRELLDPIGYVGTPGENVAELLGVTHYVPEFDRESTTADTLAQPRRRYPRTLKGWFFFLLHRLGFRKAGRALAIETGFNYPVYDVDALKNHKKWINNGDPVHVTEKIHGSNSRYVFVEGTQYCGSHEQWKADGPNVWWNAFRQHPEIGVWCQANPGKVLYGEVGPTQKGFRYGCDEGETFFFAFDVYDPNGGNMVHSTEGGGPMVLPVWSWPGQWGFALTVPVVYNGIMTDDVLKMADGPSLVPGTKHIREGVVVRRKDNGVTLKVVSNAFLEKDSK